MPVNQLRSLPAAFTAARVPLALRWQRRLAPALLWAGMAMSCLPAAAAGGELILDEGVVMKFGPGAQLVVRDKLTTGAGVVLTSLRDDAIAGQAGPGAQTPVAGDWRGLRIERSAASYGNLSFADLSVRYGGADDGSGTGAGLTLRGLNPALSALQLNDNLVGLRLLSGASPTVTSTSFLRNGTGLLVNGSSATAVSGSQFVRSTAQGILNAAPTTVIQARSNWWGDPSGPQDANGGNPQGIGDAVSAGVDYSGYLTVQPLFNPVVRLNAPAPYFDQRDIVFDLSCVNATEFRVSQDPAFAGVQYQPLSEGRATTIYTVSAGDGNKPIHVQYRNAAGTTGAATLAGGVLYDVQPPTLSITSPAEGATVYDTITVQATAADGSGIAVVEFHLDGQLYGTSIAAPYGITWNPAGSSNGVHLWRVVAYDAAGRTAEETRTVTVSHVTPPDVTGPALTNIALAGVPLANGLTITRDSRITLDASDASGIARIDVLLDGAVVAAATGTGPYTATLSLSGVANGPHTLTLRAADSLGNISTVSFSVIVAHAPPPAPVITQPASGLVTRNANLPVLGTATPGSSVQLLLGGTSAGGRLTADNGGQFSGSVTLLQGANTLQAVASDSYGTSAPSAPVAVTLDLTVPANPGTLAAANQPQGVIRLSWARSTDANVVGYDLYRSLVAFVDIGAATKVNGGRLTTTSHDDMPPADGTWYYRFVAVNAAGVASTPSNLVQGLADSVAPRAVSIAYTPLGRTDPATGRIGQGRVDVVLTVSEALQSPPYLAIVPAGGGVPIVVTLTPANATTYNGSFVIDASTPSGTANATFSARDLVGNRGTDIAAGGTLKIDAEGPALVNIVLSPASPIRNDTAQTVQATFTYSEAPKAAPLLSYLLSGPLRRPVPLSPSAIGPSQWQASFTLPGDAGLAGPETLSFKSTAVDDLDNVSTRVTAGNQFQVYQGNLPPLAVPTGFTAKAQPGGKVRLGWQAVSGAAAYQLYRQAPGQTELQSLVRATGIDYIDQTPADGNYKYAVASVRQANGQESVSGPSASVDVQAIANGPGAPQNFNLQLIGQGVLARWMPPAASSVASYNLYRAGGTSITSIQGLTPLKTGLVASVALDTQPVVNQSAYVVTALDAAGNESAISNSAYLNASLLPVTNVRVEQLDAGLPVLSWNAPNGSVAGYLVYVGPDATRIRLTPNPTSSLSLTDTGFNSGERRYTISSVDANGVEMPRVVLLPAISTQVAAGLPLQRGIMNKLQVQVTNTSSSALDGVRVVVRVPIDSTGTQFKDHKSAAFSLASNQTLLVPVVVGGYADMPGSARAQVGVEIAPNDGEVVKVATSQTLSVTDGSLVVGMATDDFTRGATGKVKLMVENTTDVDVELLTATDNGNAESSELRFKLLDGDGNVLTTQAYKQVLGANVVTLLNGMSVARIPAGSSYTSDTFNLNIPGSSPNTVRVKLEVDKLRYHTGQDDEVIITGRGSDKAVTLIDTAYTGEVTDVGPVNSFGDEDIVIMGRATERGSGTPLPNTRLKLVLNQQGFERSFIVITGASGSFTYAFKPTLTDAGLFKVSAVHPDITDRPEQKSFNINRVTVGPTPYRVDIPRNYGFTIPYIAKSGPGAAATGLRYAFDAASQPTGQLPLGINLQFPPPVNLVERQTVSLPVVFSATNEAQPSGSLILNLLSNEHGGSPVAQVKVDYLLSEARPFLVSTPSLVETGLAQGSSQLESVSVQNNGLQEAVNVRFTLSRPNGSPAPAWAAITSRPDGTLAIGDRRSVDISFTPPADTPAGVYELRLNMEGDNLPKQWVNVYASLTQSGQGGVLFKAADIYTATVGPQGNLIQGLAGATIALQNEDVTTINREVVTDSVGEALFQNMPAGSYKFRARAANHQEIGGRLFIRPGITVNQPVFLEYTVVTVEWSVRDITIQDRYEITINATFETNVPAPVVLLEPQAINLPKMSPGEVFYGNLTLTNYGLVRADNVRQQLPASDAFFRYEFLVEVPDSLGAKQRIVIPYRIIAIRSPDTAANAANASGGGCYNYSSSMLVNYNFVCANGSTSGGSASASWFFGSTSSCGGGGGGPSYPWGAGGGASSTPLPTGQRCVALPGKPCP